MLYGLWIGSGQSREQQGKYGISFDEAQSVFFDPLATSFEDEVHPETERREIIVNHSRQSRLFVVCFTERRDGIRLVSARAAIRLERRDYENG